MDLIFKTKQIRIEDLIVDERYQRDVSYIKAKNIAEKFDESAHGIIMVADYENKYYVLDGQHRVVADKMRGVKSITCQILDKLNSKQQAVIFATVNSSKKSPTASERFKSLAFAEDKDVIEIRDALESVGLRISTNGGCRDNNVQAITTIEKLYKSEGVEWLTKVMMVIKQTWSGDAATLTNNFINGVSTFLKVYSDCVSEKDFIGKFKTIPYTKIINMATASISLQGGKSNNTYAKAFYSLYNSGKRSGNVLPYKFKD